MPILSNMTKTCTRCETTKQLEDFSPSKRGRLGIHSQCIDCGRSQKQVWYQKNRDISIQRSAAYRREHPEWAKNADALHHSRYNWREKFPEKAKKLSSEQAQRRRFRKYGLTQAQYDQILCQQNEVCAACREVPSTSSVGQGLNKYDDFVVDHNHVTGKVRGLVCTNCNVALGMIRDNPSTARKLATYLEKNSQLNRGLDVQTGVLCLPPEAVN